MIRRQDPGRMQ